jgi:hypothetical protein
MANFPGVPSLSSDKILAPAVRALLEIVGLLVGDRGDKSLRAVTKAEFDALAARVKALEG